MGKAPTGSMLTLECLKEQRWDLHCSYHSCVLYRNVKTQEDCELLQEDLKNLEKWEEKWSMSFNPDNCNSISITRKINKITHTYSLHNQELKHVPSTTYLGVELSSDLTWRDQINKVCSKGNKQLGFLRRNLQINNTKVMETAYTGLVRPALEYILLNYLGSPPPQVYRPTTKSSEKSSPFCVQ